jgi:nitroreductase
MLMYFHRNFQATHFPPRTPLPNLTPTFEDLSIDENLSELQRLVKYARSSIGLQRYVYVIIEFGYALL